MAWGAGGFGGAVKRTYYNGKRLDRYARKLKELGIELEKLSEAEKKIIVERVKNNFEAIEKLYNFLNDYIKE